MASHAEGLLIPPPASVAHRERASASAEGSLILVDSAGIDQDEVERALVENRWPAAMGRVFYPSPAVAWE